MASKEEQNQPQEEIQVDLQVEDKIEEKESKPEVIKKIMERVERNAQKIDDIVNELVEQHCHQVDELITKFKECLLDKENPITEEELDDMCMRLPSYLYFIGEAQEKFGIKEDIAKSVKMELYNHIHQRTKGTIADKQAASEAGTLEEDIVYKAYQRAYKRIKQKLEAAYELLSSIKKVISRRMGEVELANIDTGRFRK